MTSEDVLAGSSGYRAQTLSTQRSSGVGLLRQKFDWAIIESSPRRYELGWYDGYVLDAARHGMRVLPILFNAPSFYVRQRGGAACPAPAHGRHGEVRPQARAALRAAGLAVAPEPRREEGADQVLADLERAEPARLLVRPAAGARLREDAAGGGQVDPPRAQASRDRDRGAAPSELSGTIPLPRFIRQLYRAGGKRWFSTLAINSYAKNHRDLGALLRGVRRIMNGHGDWRARIWLTELGWGDSGPRHRFVVGARGQAKLIARSFRYLRRSRGRLRLRGVVYYSWRDGHPYPPNYKDMWGLHTGLLRVDGSPKPAYRAFRRAVRGLR